MVAAGKSDMSKRTPIAEPMLTEEDVQSVAESVRSGWISGRGRYVEEFEKGFAGWLGAKHGVATSSGTSALHLALASLRIGPGSEVVIPAFSMAAIPFAVSYTGAKIVLADSEPLTWNIDPKKIEEKITERTRAIVAMHTYGHPADMDPIIEVARRHELHIIEDCAEAHGAEYKGAKVGTIGDIGCFSFFANKIITTGEGGMIVTGDPKLAEMAKTLRDMAFSRDPSRKFLHEHIGFNYRLTNMQAALGIAQLKRIDQFIEIRRNNAKRYNAALKDIRGISLPPETSYAKNVYWMYSILVNRNVYGISRDELMRRLQQEYGIETIPFFVPVNRQPAYLGLVAGEGHPVADSLSAAGLNLPSGNTLIAEQVEHVAAAIWSLGKT
jgi:perosamine synthetase